MGQWDVLWTTKRKAKFIQITNPLLPGHEGHQALYLHQLLEAPVNELMFPRAENSSEILARSSGLSCNGPTHFALWCIHPLHWFECEHEKQMHSIESLALLTGRTCYQTL